jgi:hypothetical protein
VLKFFNFFLKISIKYDLFLQELHIVEKFLLIQNQIFENKFRSLFQVIFLRFSERNTDFVYENYYPKIIFEIMVYVRLEYAFSCLPSTSYININYAKKKNTFEFARKLIENLILI